MPAPSLGMIMKMCVSMETWLVDHDQNVVAIHCLVWFSFTHFPTNNSSIHIIDGKGTYTHRLRLFTGVDGMDWELLGSPSSLLWSSRRKSGRLDHTFSTTICPILQHASGLRATSQRSLLAKVPQVYGVEVGRRSSRNPSRCLQLRSSHLCHPYLHPRGFFLC